MEDYSEIEPFMREINKIPLLSIQEEIVLAAQIQNGDIAAHQRLVSANLRLVVLIARGYIGLGCSIGDLVAEGCLGLTTAAWRFDPLKFNTRFATIGSFYIRQSIRHALAYTGRTVRLPVHIGDKINCLRKVESRLHDELGRPPTDREVAAELGISTIQVRQYHALAATPTSFSAPVGEDHDEFGDFVPDSKSPDPLASLQEKDLAETMISCLCCLTDREQRFIILRFGIFDGEPKTLTEIALLERCVSERVRQICNVALAKLRSAMNRKEVGQLKPLNGSTDH